MIYRSSGNFILWRHRINPVFGKYIYTHFLSKEYLDKAAEARGKVMEFTKELEDLMGFFDG